MTNACFRWLCQMAVPDGLKLQKPVPDSMQSPRSSVSTSCSTSPRELVRQTSHCSTEEGSTTSLDIVLSADELLIKATAFVCLHEAKALRAASPRLCAAVEPAARCGNARLFVCGGACNGTTLSLVEYFDEASNSWEAVSSMLQPRRCAAAAAVGTSLYICGGCDDYQAFSSAERYDCELNTWERLPDMGAGSRVWSTAVALEGFVYVCGGSREHYAPHHHHGSAERFNPDIGAWEALPRMTIARRCAVGAAYGARVFVCGGSNGKQPLKSAECFDPKQWRWKSMPDMPFGRRHAACAVVGDRLYVCGGEDESGRSFDTSAVYQCSQSDDCPDVSGTWSCLPPLLEGRWWGAGAAVAGLVYICGGTAGPSAMVNVERFDPITGEWEQIMPMRQGRVAASAVAVLQRDHMVSLQL